MNQINLKQEYGFNIITYGTLTIYAAKIRLKGVRYEPEVSYLNVSYDRGYCFISFEVIDRALAERLWHIIGSLCKNVAQARLNKKYQWVKNELC